MRFFLLFTISLIIFQGCKSPEASEITPQPSVELPQSVKELVYKSYPSASNLKGVSEVQEGRVYELSFEHNNIDYEAIVGKSGVLRIATTAGEEVPDSLVAKVEGLAIKGGRLSNYRKIVYFDNLVAYGADYELNGVKYVARFVNDQVSLENYEREFNTQDIQDLPNGIGQYIAARNKPNPTFVNTLTNLNEASRQVIINNNELRFTQCVVRIMSDGSKEYLVTVNYLGVTGLQILFDENARVLWVGSFNRIRQFEQDFNGTPALWNPNLTQQEISYFRDYFAGSSHFLGFALDNFSNFKNSFRNEYEGNRSYTFELYNSERELWALQCNADKKLVYSTYRSKW